MRKFILVSALLLVSVSAQAGQSRSLSLASMEEPKPIAEVATRLAEQARIEDTTAAIPVQTAPVQSQPVTQALAPVQTAAPVQAQTTATEVAKPIATTATESSSKPQSATPAKKANRRESDEAKARRIAARYGVYW